MELTARALELREPVQQMLLNAHGVLGAQTAFDPATERRTFTLLCNDHLSPWVIPPLLQRLQQEAPGIRIEVERPEGPGIAALTQGDVDLLLSLDESDSPTFPVLPESICRQSVLRLGSVFLRSAEDPDSGDELTQELLLRLPFIVVRQGRSLSRFEEIVQDRFGVQLNVRAVTENLLELPFLTLGSPFISVTLEPLAAVLKHSPRIRVLPPPPGVLPDSCMNMLWHRSLDIDAAHAWLRRVLVEECHAIKQADWNWDRYLDARRLRAGDPR